jgi:hypothetical protein
MSFEYRMLSPKERVWFDSFRIKNPRGPGFAQPGFAAVDPDSGAVLVGLGGGHLDVPFSWAFLLNGYAVVLYGSEDWTGNDTVGRHVRFKVGFPIPADSPIWRTPGAYRLIYEALACQAAANRPDTLLSFCCCGTFGPIIREKANVDLPASED